MGRKQETEIIHVIKKPKECSTHPANQVNPSRNKRVGMGNLQQETGIGQETGNAIKKSKEFAIHPENIKSIRQGTSELWPVFLSTGSCLELLGEVKAEKIPRLYLTQGKCHLAQV